MQVDDRGHEWNEDRVRAIQQLVQQHARRASRRIDDQMPRLRRHVHLEAAQLSEFAGRGVGAMDLRRIDRARAQPVEARALRVVVHHRGGEAACGEIARQIDCDGGLARAALRVDHQRGLHALWRVNPSSL